MLRQKTISTETHNVSTETPEASTVAAPPTDEGGTRRGQRYGGWIAGLVGAVSLIAAAVLVSQVIGEGPASDPFDPEKSRMLRLQSTGISTGDGSSEVAEFNRMMRLAPVPDNSSEVAELNRMMRLAP